MTMNNLTPLINPKEITLRDRKGVDRRFVLSEIPAVESREIVSRWIASAMPKVGGYPENAEMMLKMFSYIAVPGKPPLRLTSVDLINNHVPDLKTQILLEKEMAMYNWDFCLGEELSNLRDKFLTIAGTWLTQILTVSLQPLLNPDKPPSKS